MQECLYVCHQDLVTKMLHVDPHQRLTAPQVRVCNLTLFYASLKVQVPVVPFALGASKELQKHVETKPREGKKSGDKHVKHGAHLKLVLLRRLFLVTWSSFLKEVMEDFVLAATSFRFFVTPGSWSESSSPTESSPDRMRSLSRSDQRASVEISNQKHLCVFIVPSSEILKTSFSFSCCPLGGAVCKILTCCVYCARPAAV